MTTPELFKETTSEDKGQYATPFSKRNCRNLRLQGDILTPWQIL